MMLDILPAELLAHIFTLGTLDSELDAIQFPLMAASICRRWRHIALRTPRLWSTIRLSSSACSSKSAELWLQRSGRVPIDLILEFRDPEWGFVEEEGGELQEEVKDAMSLVLPHSNRWRTFILLVDTWSPIHAALSMLPQSTPCLERLEFYRCNEFIAYRPAFEPSALIDTYPLPHAPNLKKIVLSGVHVDWNTLPSQGLDELELSYHCADVRPPSYALHNAMKNLKRLSLENSGSGDEWLYEAQTLKMNRLEELVLGYSTPSDLLPFLQSMLTPKLRDLVIRDSSPLDACEAPSNDAHEILSHISTFKDIRALSLHRVFCRSLEYWSTLFNSLRLLESLSLAFVVDDVVTAALCARPLPSLHTLSVQTICDVHLLPIVRAHTGTLKELKVYVGDIDRLSKSIAMAEMSGVKVTSYGEVSEDEDDDMDIGEDFEDPEFDALYA